MPFGYHGCYLRIDVSQRTRRTRARLPRPSCGSILGGSGLGVQLLLDEGAAA